jgi:hypothetical protein
MSFSPPADVRANARRGLELRRKHGRGGTEVGVARARDLSNGDNIPLETIKRMNSYFSRHEVDKKGEGWGVDSAGYIAWLLWGGDAGWRWVKGILNDEVKKMTELAYSFAALVKSDKNDDGTMTVYGKATDDSIDIDQQICDNDWLKRAMPDWMLAGGNVREQHSNIAAGVATDYELKDDGHYITALVVDPVSIKKVEKGVLKGFSIGIRSPRVIRDEKAAGGRIIDGTIVEVSLVDRPANPNAKLMLAKAVDGGELLAVKQGVPTPKDVFMQKSPVDADGSVVGTVEVVDGVEQAPVVEEVTAPVEAVEAAPVEAVVEESAPAVEEAPAEETVEEVPAEEAPAEEAPVKETVEAEKSVEGDIVKGDIDLYNAAIEALTNLIKAETDEVLEEGDDENEDIHQLLKALKHLQKWHKIEFEKGELPELPSDDADDSDDDADIAGGSIELSADADEVKMCDKCDKSADECMCADKSVSIDFNDAQIESVIEKAVASAKASVTEELESLKAALKAAEAEKVRIAEELETANKSVAAGGPSRAARGQAAIPNTELLAKAAELRQKAVSTQDRVLAEGYRELADDLEAKAKKGV